MALKIYAGKDTNTGIEFVLREDNLEKAQEQATLLLEQIQVAGTLVAENFSSPKRLAPSLKDDHYEFPPISPFVPIAEYIALRLDGNDLSHATSAETAENNFREDFQIIAWIEFINYEGNGKQTITSNWVTGAVDDRVYNFLMDEGTLKFQVSTDGTNIEEVSVALDPVHGTGFWVRATYTPSSVIPVALARITLYTSDESRLLELSQITWNEESFEEIGFNELFNAPIGLLVGSELTTTSNINVPDGNIGRVAFVQGNDATFSNNTVVADMDPARDTVAGVEQWDSQTGEQWDIFGRASIGVPIVGGGIIGFLLDGVDGTYISTPDPLPPFTQSLALAIWVEFVTYPQAGEIGLIGKFEGSNISQDSYQFSLVDGVDKGLIADGTVFEDRFGNDDRYVVKEGIWTAMEWDFNTGVFTFYRSDDPIGTVHDAIVWDEVFASDDSGLNFFNDSDQSIHIGAQNVEDGLNAVIGRAFIINQDLKGVVYAEMYPNRDYVNGDTFVSTTGNLQTWTLHGGVTIEQV